MLFLICLFELIKVASRKVKDEQVRQEKAGKAMQRQNAADKRREDWRQDNWPKSCFEKKKLGTNTSLTEIMQKKQAEIDRANHCNILIINYMQKQFKRWSTNLNEIFDLENVHYL